MNSEEWSFGYLVTQFPEGILVWSKLGGGALVFIPTDALNNAQSLRVEIGHKNLYVPPIAFTARKQPGGTIGSRYEMVSYEGTSMHSLDKRIADSYFPAFSINGTINCVLDKSVGAVLVAAWCSHGIESNTNRPCPQIGDTIYCPRWSFVDATVLSRWQEHCRMGTDYMCRCVFVRDSALAYGCSWIAIAIKQCGSLPCYQPETNNQHEVAKRLAVYESLQQVLTNVREWDAEEFFQSIEQQMCYDDGKASGEQFGKVNVLKKFMQDHKGSSYRRDKQSRAENVLCSAGIGKKKRMVDACIQTTIDAKFYEEIQRWFKNAAGACKPQHVDELWARVMMEKQLSKLADH